MRAFQSAYIGRHDFPKYLPEFMLRQWFTLSARDRHLIRKTFRDGPAHFAIDGIKTGTTNRTEEEF